VVELLQTVEICYQLLKNANFVQKHDVGHSLAESIVYICTREVIAEQKEREINLRELLSSPD